MSNKNKYLIRKHRRNSRGFTLVEVTVTVVILAIMAMVGIPMLNSVVQNTRVSSAARKISNDIRLAQQRAITTGCNTQIFFNAASSYQLRDRPVANCTGGAAVVVVGVLPDSVNGTVNISTLYSGVTFQISLAAGENFNNDSTLEFNSRGGIAANDRGIVNFTNNTTGAVRIASVLPPTGRVRICKGTPCL